MELTEIVAASGNEGKIKEIMRIFKGVKVISMHEAGFEGEIFGTFFGRGRRGQPRSAAGPNDGRTRQARAL